MTTTICAPPGSITAVVFEADGTRNDPLDLTPYAELLAELAESAPPAAKNGPYLAEISVTDDVVFSKDGITLDQSAVLDVMGAGLVAALRQTLLSRPH
jgi:hypothetical protein